HELRVQCRGRRTWVAIPTAIAPSRKLCEVCSPRLKASKACHPCSTRSTTCRVSAMDDPRLTPSRGDLAAKYLEGKVAAARFVEGTAFEVADAIAPLRERPLGDAVLLTQALRGEQVTVYDRNSEGWAWGQLNSDGYVGWLPDDALVKPGPAPTHKVTAIRTFGFGGPSIKLPPLVTLPMGSTLTAIREDGGFVVISEGLFLPRQHLAEIAWREADFVTV